MVSGWSAGGHLTALILDHPSVTAGLAISGVFDLEPIRHSSINDKLALTHDEVVSLSPARRGMVGKPLAIAYGLAELPELQRQSAHFSASRQMAGLDPAGDPAGLAMAGEDHFSILEQLASPDGMLSKAAAGMI